MTLQNIDVDILCHFPDLWGKHSSLNVSSEDVTPEFFSNIIAVSAKCLRLNSCPNINVSILLTNNAYIQDLNSQHRGKDVPTDVLSFPLSETPDFSMPVMLGDIILAHEYIEEKALKAGKSFEDHLTHLVVHGFLHLLGYDHIDDQEAQEMEALEVSILKELCVKNPYESI